MMVSIFFVLDNDEKKRFLDKSFILANVKGNIMLGISSQTRSNGNINFQVKDLLSRSYTTGDIFLTT